MIYIKDNFLDKELFKLLNKTLNNFTKVEMPGKNFWVKEPDKDLVKYITTKLSIIENNDIENILCFFREAKQDQDNTWRIHNDSIISNQKPDRALVLYMSDNKSKSLNGTAFWEHKKYGDTFPNNKSSKEFNKMLSEDAEDLSKWNLKSIIGHKPNRLISYPCEYFHSKYPNEFIDSRVVFVMFYKIK
jgi:hypothetical protein|tara:strand:- start:399 stop:962 length:564 start_codon:yes stop_codon:yes gene_type:complete